MFDLAAITLTLKALGRGKTPRWLGRATHAWFLDIVRDIHPSYSKILHDTDTMKPFTVSSLLGARVRGNRLEFKQDDEVRLRITTLHPQLTLILLNQILPWMHCRTVNIHGQSFEVTNIETGGDWSGCTTFDTLLKTVEHQRRELTLNFLTPTTFKRTGDYFDAIPYPDLVFGSLLDRWNAFSPVLMPRDVEAVLGSRVAVYRHQTDSEILRLGGAHFRRPIPVFSGKVRFRLIEDDRILRRFVHVLAAYAKYSGIGYRTTMGLGQARVQ
ncbi:MAG: CRISPR-associated endoribonuclease Cas6 [Chloroflexota bacterium]